MQWRPDRYPSGITMSWPGSEPSVKVFLSRRSSNRTSMPYTLSAVTTSGPSQVAPRIDSGSVFVFGLDASCEVAGRDAPSSTLFDRRVVSFVDPTGVVRLAMGTASTSRAQHASGVQKAAPGAADR